MAKEDSTRVIRPVDWRVFWNEIEEWISPSHEKPDGNVSERTVLLRVRTTLAEEEKRLEMG